MLTHELFPRALRAAAVVAVAAAALTACRSGQIETPFGNFRYIPAPLPRAPFETDEYIPFVYDGTEFCVYDVDGDGIPDWLVHPRGMLRLLIDPDDVPWSLQYETPGALTPLHDTGTAEAIARVFPGMIATALQSLPDDRMPPLVGSAEALLASRVVPLEDDLLRLGMEARWDLPADDWTAGWIDVRVPLPHDPEAPAVLPDLAPYPDLRHEVEIVWSERGGTHFLTVRLVGAAAQVVDYLLDLGLESVAGLPELAVPLQGGR